MNHLIYPINTGFCTSNPKTYHYHHSAHKYYDNITEEDRPLPVFCYLIETKDELIMVDTGMAYADRANQYHHPGSTQEPDQAAPRAVEKLGFSCDDVKKIIFTHLHWDHTFYMSEFKNAVYYASRKEYEFAIEPLPLYYKSYEYGALGITPPFDGLHFELIDGETEIVPGVRTYPTPGHTIGHQAVEVDTKDGTYHLIGDAIFLYDNLKPIPEIHYDLTPVARFSDIIGWWHSAREIKRRAASIDMILPTHEPSLVGRFQNTPVLGR